MFTTPGNPGNLLEFEMFPGNPGSLISRNFIDAPGNFFIISKVIFIRKVHSVTR